MTPWRKPCVAGLIPRYRRDRVPNEHAPLADIVDVLIDWPGTVLHAHAMSDTHALRLIRWQAETGGDQARLSAYLPWLRALRPSPGASTFRAVARAEPRAEASLSTQPAPAEPQAVREPVQVVPPAPAPVTPPAPPSVPVVTKPAPTPPQAAPRTRGRGRVAEQSGQPSLL